MIILDVVLRGSQFSLIPAPAIATPSSSRYWLPRCQCKWTRDRREPPAPHQYWQMSTRLAPISYASSIVGFTSFAFTFFTFVKVFWETILTLWHAPKQMRAYLDNLRIEIHNERAYFKSALRRTRSRSKSVRRYHEDVAPLKILNTTVRRIHRLFIKLEEPFLDISPSEAEKDIERDSEESVGTSYAPMTLARRWKWMRTKSDIISIADEVNRIQTQRIACDTTNLLMWVSCTQAPGGA